MSVISLHRKYSFVDYQNRVCSFAAFFTLVALLISLILPLVWIFKVNNNSFSSSKDLSVFEQPMVKFPFKYIFIAEHSMEASEAILCSSFEQLHHLSDTENCSKMKVIEKDENFDGIPDEIHFTFDFNTKFHYGVKSVSMAIFLDTRIEDQCQFRVPSAIVINKKQFYNNLNDRQIVIRGTLQPVQSHPLICPFFLRNIKSHFFYEKLNENQTNLEEFGMANIQENLNRNPMSFQFQETSTDLVHVDNFKTSVKVKLRIPQSTIRYKKTFWQNVNDIWINYVAIFIVTFVIANLILNFLFESRWLMARRKIYIEKTD